MQSYTAALVGNPNCGKTALFNRLTGARQKVANYAGVTVERKEGRFVAPSGRQIKVIDLPGAYSLDALGPDEIITRDVCLGHRADEPRPDLILCVADATNLQRHLRFILEIRDLGLPMILVLNMMDIAIKRGMVISLSALQDALGCPVVDTIAIERAGITRLIEQLDHPPAAPARTSSLTAADGTNNEVMRTLRQCVLLSGRGDDLTNRIDQLVLNKVIGPLVLLCVMFVLFQVVYTGAQPAVTWLTDLFDAANTFILARMPRGLLRDFLTQAGIGGLGAVIVFLPQILILFFLILALEESGYLPRAAFLLDTLMSRIGLTGRSFIPLLSSFACAIPGIMASRSIPDANDRRATILVAPLMTCSARLPVYTLLISAFVPEHRLAGFLSLRGLILLCLYLLGIAGGVTVALTLRTMRPSTTEHSLLMELPPFHMPRLTNLAIGIWERAQIFLKRVTGIIFAMNTLLWLLTTFPGKSAGAQGPAINYSIAGMIGHVVAPIFAPIGFNWQICVALIPGLAAREIAVSALGTVYSVSGTESTLGTQLSGVIAHQWSLATALSLLVWYVFAPQCFSTLAVIKRETNSWRTAALAASYLFAMAYAVSFLTYQVASRIT